MNDIADNNDKTETEPLILCPNDSNSTKNEVEKNKCNSDDRIEEYSSENFKLEIRNLPNNFGFGVSKNII